MAWTQKDKVEAFIDAESVRASMMQKAQAIALERNLKKGLSFFQGITYTELPRGGKESFPSAEQELLMPLVQLIPSQFFRYAFGAPHGEFEEIGKSSQRGSLVVDEEGGHCHSNDDKTSPRPTATAARSN
jgi:hypothetical protein